MVGGTKALVSLTQGLKRIDSWDSREGIRMNYGDEMVNTTTALLLFVLLGVAVATDLKSRRIPNLLLLPALSLALMLHAIDAGLAGLVTAAGGLALGLAMLLPLYAVGGMGAGDVKLLGVIGSFLGPGGAVVAGLTTMIAGAVLGIVFLLWQRCWPALGTQIAQFSSAHNIAAATPPIFQPAQTGSRKSYIPYAPAIAAGTIVALWYLDFLPEQYPG